jgi:short-subunit dehydrogenase
MVTVVIQDLALPGAAQALFAAVEERGITIDRLINNAGFGAYGRLAGQPAAVHAAMMQVNMVALTELTRLYLPGMIARGGGRILNVASMAGFLSGPLQAVYYATKAYVLSFSEAVAEETRGTGVTVTALCPGPTATRFQTAAGLDGTPAFKFAASARGVAEYGYAGMERGVAIAIPGLVNRIAITALRATPRAMATRLSRLSMEKRTRIRT